MQGTLSPDALSTAIRELEARRASGVLYIIKESIERRLIFRDGGIVAADGGLGGPLALGLGARPYVDACLKLDGGEFRFEAQSPDEVADATLDLAPGADTKPSVAPPVSGGVPMKLGRFTVQRVLGRGSMGAVLLAQDPAIDRVVAIKLIQTAVHLPPSQQEKYRERFYREASSAGQLIHPNIVTVFDVGHADDDTPFIVMEYIDGRTLTEILETETLSFDQAFRIANDILEGLSFAHSQGIVHRDIKPSNIIVTSDMRGKIMDFGIAHVVGSELTAEDDLLGSPYYMAPEQLSKGAIDQRTDLFSFAVVLYRMLTGTLPFTGDSFAAIAQSILHEDPAPPDAANPSVTPTLRSVILRCLDKHPSERYETAEELQEALRSARRGASGDAVTRRVRRTVDAHRDRWLPISVALILGAFLVFGLALTGERQFGSANEPPVVETVPPPVELPEPPVIEEPPPEPEPEPIEPAEPVEPPKVRDEPPPPPPAPEPEPEPEPPPVVAPTEPTMAELFYEARMSLERGELLDSQKQLEALLLKDPSFEGAGELLVEVTDRIWEQKLPLEFAARHKHRFRGCDGTLSLTTLGVRFTSRDHDWAWSHEDMRLIERSDSRTIYLELVEKESLIGLGGHKRYRFELAHPLDDDDWTRYQRLTR